MSRWYRAYIETVTDPKLGEVALVAGCSRSVAIAAWHCILESAAQANAGGAFDTTPRRVAVILGEPLAVIEAVFAEMKALAMIGEATVTAWAKRQFESDNSTERSRKHREAKRNGDATLQQRFATPPYTETETDIADDDAQASASVHLADQCLEAAGLSNDPKAVLWPIRPIANCIRDGAVLSEDVLPTIRRLRAEGRRFGSWSYPCQAIMDAKALREAPAPLGRATGPPNRKNGGGFDALEAFIEMERRQDEALGSGKVAVPRLAIAG
jgi:hypothetical protein